MFIVKVREDHLYKGLSSCQLSAATEYPVIQMTIESGYQGTPPRAWFLILDDQGAPVLLPDVDVFVTNGVEMLRLAQLQEQAARLQIEAVQQAAAGAGMFISPPRPRIV